MKEQRDATLMLGFQRKRDYAAFEELFRRHKLLLRFLIQLTGSPCVGEDVSQQTWLCTLAAQLLYILPANVNTTYAANALASSWSATTITFATAAELHSGRCDGEPADHHRRTIVSTAKRPELGIEYQ